MSKVLAKFLIVFFIGGIAFWAVPNFFIISSQGDRVYRDLLTLPTQNVALLLGTSPRMRSGRPNPFFEGRIRAVVELYENDKISFIVASGSEDLPFYSEPGAMREALLEYGIPEDRILKDGAGDDTFQSIYKMGQNYGSETFIIVTQEFHSFRALFIAETLGLSAKAYGVPNVGGAAGVSMTIRESLARVKAVFDVLVFRWKAVYG